MKLTQRAKAFRREFSSRYQGAEVVALITRGLDSKTIADRTGYSVTTVAAVRANLTRGNYAPYVSGNTSSGFVGVCRF